MTFKEWYSTQKHQLSNEQVCSVIWNAAIEAAANVAEEQDCDQTEYMCRTIERAASAIRALSSNDHNKRHADTPNK